MINGQQCTLTISVVHTYTSDMDIEGIKNLPAIMNLHGRGIDIAIEPAVRSHSVEAELRYIALLRATNTGEQGWAVELHVNPDAEAAELEFAARDYLEPVLDRLAHHGTEPDGWQHCSDGSYQKWIRLHYFGDVAEIGKS